MAEFLFELYSEEIPTNLQISAREEIRQRLNKSLEDEGIKTKSLKIFSTPTRLTILIQSLPLILNIPSKEIRGPKVGVLEDVVNNFLRAHDLQKKDIYEKETDKGKFFFIKTKNRKIFIKDVIIKNLLGIISTLRWKKSMKWSNTEIIWGRPLRSILAVFNGNLLDFNYGHIKSSDKLIIEKDLTIQAIKVKNFNDYKKLLKKNNIVFNHEEREKIILKKFKTICQNKKFLENFNKKTLQDVINITENPNILLIDFDKKYLKLPNEIIISTLEDHQRYFPLFNNKKELTNNFLVVANKSDNKNIIKEGNKKVVEARLSDAMFFWDKDKSKNLIKQIIKLKKITFYEKIGTLYDKSTRLRKLAGYLSDEFNISKEKVEISASISKSDLCSDIVGEFPELQGKMGRYFALAQGFEEDVANAISDHYLPLGNNSIVPKKPISYTIAIVDKIDSLVSFFLINEKPSSSKDPFALRRSAIGLLRIIIENKLNLKIRDLINYNIALLEEQGVKSLNSKTEIEIIDFLRERMKNLLKDKNIKSDIIEAALSSHLGDNFYDLYKKNIMMNKYIDKEVGKNAISSFKRAYNIIEREGKNIQGRPDTVLFRKEAEKNLFQKVNEIRTLLTNKDVNKNYENLIQNLSELKPFTDNFFDNVVVNDENMDIKNNRLELLKMFCNTFNILINFSKLEGLR